VIPPITQQQVRAKARSAEPFEGPELLRFAPEALKANLALVDLVREWARKAATPAKVALAWLPAKKPWIVPIPGTTKLQRLDEDLGVLSLAFTSKDLREIDEAASKIEVQGARLPPAVLAMSGR